MRFSIALAAYATFSFAASSTSKTKTSSSSSASSTGDPDIWFLINTPTSPVAQCSNTVLTWQEGNLDDKSINISITDTSTNDMSSIVKDLPIIPTSYKWLVEQSPGTYFLTVTGALVEDVYSGNFTISKGSTSCVGKSSAANSTATSSSGASLVTTTLAPTATITVQPQPEPNTGNKIMSGYLSWVVGFLALI